MGVLNLFVITAYTTYILSMTYIIMKTLMGQVVRANMPVCYSQTGMFDVYTY
jgi:hypothetical protein